jgi:exopolyphosphatase/guanosine-5'-triphosphate,3'-diphosphate pyrophosphatase
MDRFESPPRLAAIDVGTNSIRLVVAEVESPATYRILDDERAQTRLGEGLYDTGRIGEDAFERSLAVLGTMKAIAEGNGVDELRVIGTSALREAENGDDFVREARERHGLDVEIIPADEEARLAFRSVKKHFPLDDNPTSIVDIGGGSMEVILVVGTVIDEVHSLRLGAVRLTDEYVHSDPIRPHDWKTMRKGIRQEIRRHIGKPNFTTPTMIGSGGTFSALASMAQFERFGEVRITHGYVLSRADLVHLMERLKEVPLKQRKQIRGLNPDRADIILAGAAAIERLVKALGVQRIVVNERGIRDGVLLEMIRRLFPEQSEGPLHENRMNWVRSFGRKCQSNEPHCEQTARLAGELFDALAGPFDLDPADRELLIAAALLHDVGYLISHAKHHKHSYHIISQSGLPGFTGREIELIALIARYHRRAHPKKSHAEFTRLPEEDRDRVRKLAGILRIVDGLDRTHGQTIEGLDVQVGKDRIAIGAEALANPEVDVWDANRKAELFEEAFGRKTKISWVPTDGPPSQESLFETESGRLTPSAVPGSGASDAGGA